MTYQTRWSVLLRNKPRRWWKARETDVTLCGGVIRGRAILVRTIDCSIGAYSTQRRLRSRHCGVVVGRNEDAARYQPPITGWQPRDSGSGTARRPVASPWRGAGLGGGVGRGRAFAYCMANVPSRRRKWLPSDPPAEKFVEGRHESTPSERPGRCLLSGVGPHLPAFAWRGWAGGHEIVEMKGP